MAEFGLKRSLAELRQGLFDFEFSGFVTARLLPSIYRLGIGLIAVLTVYAVLTGFRASWLLGLSWLLFFGPALFVASVIVLRISLEVILVLFRLLDIVENLQPVIHEISGHADEIVTDLPRIQFWKSWQRSGSSDAD